MCLSVCILLQFYETAGYFSVRHLGMHLQAFIIDAFYSFILKVCSIIYLIKYYTLIFFKLTSV